jgi:hypothetical protein
MNLEPSFLLVSHLQAIIPALGNSLPKAETISQLRQARGPCGLSGPFVD